MNIKNNINLSKNEAVELLAKLADSLEQKGEFAFDLRGQEVSIEVGDELNAHMEMDLEHFSLVFSWGQSIEELETEWRQPADADLASATLASSEDQETEAPYQLVKEVKLPEELDKEEQVIAEATPVMATTRRALPDRMVLNTSTLPLDGGYWSSAFTEKSESQWSPIKIEGELENRKWSVQADVTTIQDLTPASAKPKSKRSRSRGKDDDLFSDLDKLSVERPRPKTTSSSQITSRSTTSTPSTSRQAAAPASSVSSGSEEETEDWVKPSEVLKTKATGSPLDSMPKPGASSPLDSMPKPGQSEGIPVPTSKSEKDVQNWEEPPRETETGEDWVKPSEFLKSKSGKTVPKPKEDLDRKIKRPPPEAPDSKKKDKKSKGGWASWD